MPLQATHVDIDLVCESGDPRQIGDALLSIAGFSDASVVSYQELAGGNPVMAQVFRIAVEGGPGVPDTAVVKIPAKCEVDRRREAATGAYAREVKVYGLLKDMQGDFQPIIYSSVSDPQMKLVALLIEDLGALPRRSEFDIELVRSVLRNLARIHQKYWGARSIGSAWWIRNGRRADIFNDDTELFAVKWEALANSPRLHPCDEPEVNKVGEYLNVELLSVLDQLDDRPPTLTHGDLHTANFMFRRSRSKVEPVLIDWQEAVYCGASSDVTKFLSTTLDPSATAEHFDDLIAGYHDELGDQITGRYPYITFRRDVMLALLGTFANYVIAADTVEEAYNDPTAVNRSLRQVSRSISVLRPLDEL